jgi:hypothetical protein
VSAQRDRTLFELEQRLARVGGKVSAEEAAALIADDFVEFGASGKVWSREEVVAAISQWPASDRKLENFSVRELSAAVCLVTYRADSSLRSSIWRRIGDRWQMIFHQGTALLFLLAVVILGLAPVDAGAETYVSALSCTNGPYRLVLPKSYKAVRTIGQLIRERVVKTEEHGAYTVSHRELRFNGLELVLVTASNKPNQYVVSRAVVSSRAWKIAGPLRVGSPAKTALRGLQTKDLPQQGELEFSGETDSIRVNLAGGRVLDVEYSCSSG